MALGLLDGHLNSCVLDAAKQGDDAAKEKPDEASNAIAGSSAPEAPVIPQARTALAVKPRGIHHMITNYVVTGMTCGHCVNHVTEESRPSPASPRSRSSRPAPLTVSSDTAIDFGTIEEAVAEAGDYKVALA